MFQLKNTTLKAEFISFSGGERHIQLKNLPTIAPAELTLRVDLTEPQFIFDLLLFDNALKAHYQQQIPLNLTIPYLPYARQDRVCATGQAFSLQIMAQLLAGLNLKSFNVWDVHSPIALNLLSKAKNIAASDIMAQSPALLKILADPRLILICPDKGAKTRTLAIKKRFKIKTMLEARKIRDKNTGEIIKTQLDAADLNGKIAFISDDICDGGMTFIKLAEILKERGVQSIILYVTHGIFSQGLGVFDGLIDQIFSTDSFTQTANKKLTTIYFNEVQS